MALGVGRKEMVMVGVLLVGVLLAVLNQTLLSPALPTIMNDLAVDATTVQWLTSGYSLVEAVVIPLSAYLIGRFSTRQLFISAFALFTAGSLAAAIAPNFWVLLLGRVLQAACTGMSMPMVFTVILLVALLFADIRHDPWVDAAFKGMRPAVVALIVAPVLSLSRGMHPALCAVIVGAALAIWGLGWSPIAVLVAAALCGIGWELYHLRNTAR